MASTSSIRGRLLDPNMRGGMIVIEIEYLWRMGRKAPRRLPLVTGRSKQRFESSSTGRESP
jgi:hypothetical protein